MFKPNILQDSVQLRKILTKCPFLMFLKEFAHYHCQNICVKEGHGAKIHGATTIPVMHLACINN